MTQIRQAVFLQVIFFSVKILSNIFYNSLYNKQMCVESQVLNEAMQISHLDWKILFYLILSLTDL